MPARISRSETAKRQRNLGGALLTAMTSITAGRFWNRDWLRFFGSRRHGNPTRTQHLLNPGDELLKDRFPPKYVPAPPAHLANGIHDIRSDAALRAACNTHCNGDNGVELVDVGHVVDERLGLAGMQESDRGSVARRQNGRLGQPVQAGGSLTQTSVGDIRRRPVAGVILPSFPFHAMLLRENLIEPSHACPLDPPQLLYGAAFGRGFPETHLVHLPHYLEPGFRRQGEAGLIQQAVGARTARLPRRVETDARLPDP